MILFTFVTSNGKFTPKEKVCGQGTEFMPRDTRLPRKESKLCITERNLNGKQQQWGKFSLGMFRRPRHGCLISTWPVPCAQSTCNLPDHGTRALTQQCNGFDFFTIATASEPVELPTGQHSSSPAGTRNVGSPAEKGAHLLTNHLKTASQALNMEKVKRRAESKCLCSVSANTNRAPSTNPKGLKRTYPGTSHTC